MPWVDPAEVEPTTRPVQTWAILFLGIAAVACVFFVAASNPVYDANFALLYRVYAVAAPALVGALWWRRRPDSGIGTMYGQFDPLVSDRTGLLSHDDARSLASRLGPDSSAAVMLFENTWATKFRDAVLDADGELVLSERIPKAVVDEMVASAAEAAA